jgi:hypothetical protein
MNRLLTEEHYEKSYAKAPAFSGQMEDFIMWELFQCLVESMRNCREGQNLAFLTETETATVPNIPIGTKSQRLMRAIRARFYNMEETGRQLDKFRVKLLTLRIMQGASVSRFLH